MAKPSKKKWAREKRERRVLAQKKQAAKVAAKLLGVRKIMGFDVTSVEGVYINHLGKTYKMGGKVGN